MDIKKVLRNENIGKEYELNGVLYKLITTGVCLELINSITGEAIEENEELIDIVYGNFIEKTEWLEVPVDTKVLVSDDGINWLNRYFAMYEDGIFYVWEDGKSSFTLLCPNESNMIKWKYCKLYEE